VVEYTEWAKSRYRVIISFFTGIVSDGREIKYRTKKGTKCHYLRRTINTLLYTVYILLAHLVYRVFEK